MKVIKVIPIGRGLFKEPLSYFTAKDVARGAIVSAPVKNRQIDALVIDSRPLGDVKASIKSAGYSLKKINRVKSNRLFLVSFLKAAEKAADYFASPLGQILKSLIPKTILEHCAELPSLAAEVRDSESSPAPAEKFALQDTEEERFSFYKTLIRESFSKNSSVFLGEPTLTDLERAVSLLERGISEYTIALHPSLPKKNLLAAWSRLLTDQHPLLIIATPLFLSLPRRDIKTLIMEKENTSAYKSLERPFLDFRKFSEFLAATWGAKLIFGDEFLRTETSYRVNKEEFLPAANLKQRLLSGAEQILLNVKPKEILSLDLQQILEEALERHERTFILANRRGLTPIVICNDCGEAVRCGECWAPLALHQPNIFVCHRCGTIRSAETKCSNCQSWRLVALGSGIEKVKEFITTAFPKALIFHLDSDRIKSRERAQALVARFLSSPGSILLGTEMAVFYLKEKIENGLAVAVDSLLTLPDFRASEKLFSLLLRLRSLTTKRFLIQSRYSELPLLQYALGGRLLDFYRDELKERHDFEYPPFKLFVKISLTGKKDAVTKQMKELKKALSGYGPIVFPALNQPKGKYRVNLLLKISPDQWPDETMLAFLKNLPPAFVVTVDPDTIL
jgi:primosomal protein N' (replication factor Y)